MERLYFFGENMVTIHVPNGGYLTPEKIQHYEFCFGALQEVRYGNSRIKAN